MKSSLSYRKTVILTLGILLATLLPLTLSAQENGTETFDTPELTGWEHSPDVAITGGVLRIHPGNFALRFGDLQDPTITLRVKYGTPGEAVIGYAFRDEGRYLLHLSGGHAALIREAGESGTELAHSESPTLRPDTWLQVQITVNDGQHTVTVDGESVLAATDPEPLQPGALFLHAVGEAPAEFDDLTLAGTAEPPAVAFPPPEQTQPDVPPPTSVTSSPNNNQGTAASLIDEFFASQASHLELTTFVINLILATLCAYILSRVYIHWGASLSNRRKFAANLILITITTTFIILVVRSSVALSLGLVLSLIHISEPTRPY